MSDFLYTTTKTEVPGGTSEHVVYLDLDNQVGFISDDGNGPHQIVFEPATEPVVDELGNVIEPGKEAAIYISAAIDGHTHEIIPYTPKENKSKDKDKDIIDRVHTLLKTSRELESKSIKDAEKAEKFHNGEQWDESTRGTLLANDRAALTFNLIEKHIDELSGYQRKRRTDIKYLPLEEGDQRTADLYSLIAKHIQERSMFQREDSVVALDQYIQGRGFYDVYVSTEKDIRGEVVIERFNPECVSMGPHEKEDGSDAEYLCKHKMYSLPKLKQMYPEKAGEIESNYEAVSFFQGGLEKPKEHVTFQHDQYGKSDNTIELAIGMGDERVDLVDVAKKEFRLIECQEKVYEPEFVIVNPSLDFVELAKGWSEKDANKFSTIEGFRVIKKINTKVKVTHICANVVLVNEITDETDFFTIPVYAKKRGNRFWGKVRAVIDAQKEVNYRRSQAIDIGNRMAGGTGWFYDDDTFPEGEENNFKKNAGRPGFVQKVNTINRLPVEKTPGQFPVAIVQLLEMAIGDIREFMNIHVDPNGANESGTMFMQRIEQTLRGNEFLFDNMAFSKKQVGRIMFRLINKYYSPERVFRIVSSESASNPEQIDGQPSTQFTIDEIAEIMANADAMQYDVVVAESAYSPTARLGILVLLGDLAANGAIQVPPEIFLELADLPEETKKKIQTYYAQAQQAEAQQAEATKDMEIQKTAIANIEKLQEAGIGMPGMEGQEQGPSIPQISNEEENLDMQGPQF